MLRFVKKIVWSLSIVIGCQSAFGFALIGPVPLAVTEQDGFQAGGAGQNIAYNLGGDIGVPKDIRDEYRRNTPVMYWAFDDSFWEYFSTNGIAAIEQTMEMYNSVGKVSQLNIDDYPLDSRRINYRAQADGLLDLKSSLAGLMTEQLGFFEPTRWVWALHDRQVLGPPGCPANVEYTVFPRNFSPDAVGADQYPTTAYVNGVLYSYFILEFCNPPVPLADAVEFPVDPLASPFSAVGDWVSEWYEGLPPGAFYTSLTRDDVAAMKYLMNTNNFNNEASGTRTTEFITNSEPAAIQTQDLSVLAGAARTNNAATLQTLFPGLIITSSSNSFGLQVTTNITEILVNAPFDPAGTPPSHPQFSTNYTTNFVTFFTHTFANVITNSYSTRAVIGVVTPILSGTNTFFTVKPVPISGVFGDFFILPTNTCDAQILSNLLTTVVVTTNLPTVIAAGTTNGGIAFTPGSITFSTNHLVVYLPVTCPVDSVAPRQGVDRVIFLRRDYDSLTGQVWDQVTNNYTLLERNPTNDSIVNLRHFSRRVPRPDFLFSAADLASDGGAHYTNSVDGAPPDILNIATTFVIGENLVFRTIVYDGAGRSGSAAGPGTIQGPPQLPAIFVLNKLAPLFDNLSASAPFFIPNETTAVKFVGWGSFDGSTNAPVVYPNGTSLQEFENILTGPASDTPTLPDGNIGAAYSAQLTGKGGVPPYSWSLAPGSPGLPDGLNLSAGGKITGTPTGPASVYDFTLRITDSNGVFRDVQYTITVF